MFCTTVSNFSSTNVHTLTINWRKFKSFEEISISLPELEISDYIKLCKFLVENKHSYATNRYDVGKNSILSRIRLKPDAKLQTQRPTKIPIHYRGKLSFQLSDLQKIGGIKQNGSTPHGTRNYRNSSMNPSFIIKKNDCIKIVLDARHLNSNTV